MNAPDTSLVGKILQAIPLWGEQNFFAETRVPGANIRANIQLMLELNPLIRIRGGITLLVK